MRADPGLGRALPGRAPAADRRAAGPAVPGAVRGGPGCAVRGPPPPGQPRPGALGGRRVRLRRLRHRRRAGEGEPGHHHRLGRRRTAGGPSRGTCSASPSPTTSSPPSRTGPTPSTASRRPGWPATPRSTPATAGSTSTPRPPGGRSGRSTPSATATPARTTPAPTCTTCSRPRRCWPSTLCTIHNERFIVRLVDDIRVGHRAGLLRRRSGPSSSARYYAGATGVSRRGRCVAPGPRTCRPSQVSGSQAVDRGRPRSRPGHRPGAVAGQLPRCAAG